MSKARGNALRQYLATYWVSQSASKPLTRCPHPASLQCLLTSRLSATSSPRSAHTRLFKFTSNVFPFTLLTVLCSATLLTFTMIFSPFRTVNSLFSECARKSLKCIVTKVKTGGSVPRRPRVWPISRSLRYSFVAMSVLMLMRLLG